MILKNWDIEKFWGSDDQVVSGNVYGNPKFNDGTYVTTSSIKEIKDIEGGLEIHTLNSIYTAMFVDKEPEE